MTDLNTRFRALDKLRAPDLWNEIEERAMAMQPMTRRSNPWVLIAAVALLLVAIAGVALVGSGVIRLPIVVDVSLTPSATEDASADASATPVEPVPASWTATGSMALERAEHSATLLSDGTVLVVGSVFVAGPPGCCAASATTELYDPTSGTWTATGDMIEGRLGHTAVRLADGRVLVAGGGGDGVSPGLTAELYDPIDRTWTATGSMIEAGAAAGGAATATRLLDGRVLVMDGAGSSAQLYDPSSRTWSATGNMIDPRSWNTATLLPDGTVLVAGGMDSTGSGDDEVVFLVASAELYDPASETWSTTGSMSETRHNHRATPLADGRVLVTGGGVASVEVYDPASRTWTTTVSMIEGREVHTATLLSDGTVLVVGGYALDASGTLTSAEVYDPDGNP